MKLYKFEVQYFIDGVIDNVETVTFYADNDAEAHEKVDNHAFNMLDNYWSYPPYIDVTYDWIKVS